jgi:hypothetical protein
MGSWWPTDGSVHTAFGDPAAFGDPVPRQTVAMGKVVSSDGG